MTTSRASSRWLWLAAAILMLAELLLFNRMTARHHAAFYPRWDDQIQYLSEAYQAYETAQAHGFVAGLGSTLTKTSLQGGLHDFAALFAFTAAGGASRSAALSLNLLVFLAWQAAVLVLLPRLTGSRTLGWLGFGLLLCAAGPWTNEAGSAVDFRLDHGAMCLFGVTATLALLTRGFRATGWSLAFGLAAAITLLERFLTGAYFAAVFVALAAWILAGQDRWPRLRNLILAGGVMTVLAGPAFWFNRAAIYNYYWVGHVTGAESLARFRGLDLWHSVRFIFANLTDRHLGAWFGAVTAGVTATLGLLATVGPRRPASPPRLDWLVTALVFLLAPAAVLSVHPQKSEYVLGVLVPGVVLLLLWLWAELARRLDRAAGAGRRNAPALVAAVTVALGALFFTRRQLDEPHDPAFLASAAQVNGLADHIYSAAQLSHLSRPVIGVDQVVDFVDAQSLAVICYERHRVWYSFVAQLPNSILAEPDDVTFYKLNLCDFILLTDRMEGDGNWPYDKQMRRLYPQLKEWCESHRRLARFVRIQGREMSLYQRREFP